MVEYMKNNPFGDVKNVDDNPGYISSQNMLTHPTVDMESLYSHKTLGWLFTDK